MTLAHDPQAERDVIGGLAINRTRCMDGPPASRVLTMLTADDFADRMHADLYVAMRALLARGHGHRQYVPGRTPTGAYTYRWQVPGLLEQLHKQHATRPDRAVVLMHRCIDESLGLRIRDARTVARNAARRRQQQIAGELTRAYNPALIRELTELDTRIATLT